MNGNNSHRDPETREFIEDQLMETTRALFAARTVREAHFLQSKLTYLKRRIKEMKIVKKKKR